MPKQSFSYEQRTQLTRDFFFARRGGPLAFFSTANIFVHFGTFATISDRFVRSNFSCFSSADEERFAQEGSIAILARFGHSSARRAQGLTLVKCVYETLRS